MKILLLGEYSNFHNSLKQGLEQLGHHVVLAGRKDGFKSLPVDISFEPTIVPKAPFRYLRGLIYKLTNFDLAAFEIVLIFFKKKHLLKGFDYVQLINEYPIKSTPFFDRLLLKSIFKNNSNVYVSACGNDVIYLNYILNAPLSHHTLTPFVKDPKLKEHFKYSLSYLGKSHKKLHDYVVKKAKAYIPADMDYEMAYKDLSIGKPLIPFPVNIDTIKYTPLKVNGEIHIFHGINRVNFYKKGNDYFCKALEAIKVKYKDRVLITEVTSIPYRDYIKLYNECHILLDQVYAYDQGYNALEAMAQGKVVFTGVSNEFVNHYKITNTIGIHTIPDTEKIINDLSYLIEHPKEIEIISKNARAYIEQYHDYKKVAKQYLDCWQS
ncbi:glycosyltransferase [Tamlana fucoidanivorans]|uniref:Glycosyltransferase n=1 Tax=Allotamlana fucoidanivorans TaxID=2583814 RepID=A0A5C4SKL5_9FLAO|nr:glycosyltransferase [Tamlana fucoidanivorans]TNJ43581.1 glycosyltransferase [Tamlana fucoidanivorans]